MASVSDAIQRGVNKNPFARYGLAVVLTAAALGVRWLIGRAIPGAPFITFFPAILACAYLLGRGPAALCMALSAAAGWFVFIRPASGLEALWPSVWLSLAYLVIGV